MLKQSLRLVFTILMLAPLTAHAAGDAVAQGAFSSYVDKEERPRLAWETLKGYRLFFHPGDAEPARRGLTIAVPVEQRLSSAWAIVRPVSKEGTYADAWLRVEGEPTQDKVSITWDGTYRGQPFPDGPYRFEVHLKFDDGSERQWDVQVLKRKEYPLFAKIGGWAVESHPLRFHGGQFEPLSVAASISLSAGSAAIIARVFAPDLEEPFNTSGLLVQARQIEDAEGKPVLSSWTCLCEDPLPADSPARQAPKKVRCDWDLSTAAPGVWDLRLGLYHGLKHRVTPDPCDEPQLDDDAIRIRLLP